MKTHAVSVLFHNPLEHPEHVFNKKTKENEPSGKKIPQTVRFSIQTHEDGARLEFEVAPGEEVEIPGEWAYAIKSLAPQLVEGPAPKPGAGTQQVKK